MGKKKRKKIGFRKKVLSLGIFLSILLLGIVVSAQVIQQKDDLIKGSGIQIETLNSIQVEELSKLCKVWGFVKYYHPAVVERRLDWDRALFDTMQKVLVAEDSEQVDQILYDWIQSLGDVTEQTGPSDDLEKILEADLEWINNDIGNQDLKNLLFKISKTYLTDHSKGYINFKEYGYVYLNNEDPYLNMDYSDKGYRLLGLFRYWNIIQYYYPYRTIIDYEWNDVLPGFIEKFVEGEDELSYKLSICELVSHIQDSHGTIWDKAGTLYRFWGSNQPPFTFQIIDGQIVVTKIAAKYEDECALKQGDIILKQDGKPIEKVIKEKEKYLSISHDEAKGSVLQHYLFLTNEESLNFTILRDGEKKDIQVICYEEYDLFPKSTESHKLLEESIGYINPEALQPDEIHKIMKEFNNTKGLIVDLRYYPSYFIAYSLGNYLMPESIPFTKISLASPEEPGTFTAYEAMTVGEHNPNYYKGKVILLINELTISQPEFITMALRLAPEALVVGSPSTGADGDIVEVQLPGGVITYFSGIGVYYPDGSDTQRIGIIPDVYVRPTIEGIKAGRDELLEKAIELINLPNKVSDLKL